MCSTFAKKQAFSWASSLYVSAVANVDVEKQANRLVRARNVRILGGDVALAGEVPVATAVDIDGARETPFRTGGKIGQSHTRGIRFKTQYKSNDTSYAYLVLACPQMLPTFHTYMLRDPIAITAVAVYNYPVRVTTTPYLLTQ